MADGAETRGLVAIPAYNEGLRIGGVLDRLRACELPEDIVVIDDGSADATRAEAEARGVRVIVHQRNLGYRAALRSALAAAVDGGYAYLVLLDGDGQHDPCEVARLRERAFAADRPDLVIGSRFLRPTGYRASLARRTGMLAFEALTRLAGAHVHDTTSGYKLIAARLVRRLVDAPFNDLHAELVIFAARSGLRVAEVPVQVRPGPGTSMYTWRDAVAYPLRTLLAAVRLLRWERRRARRDAEIAGRPRR